MMTSIIITTILYDRIALYFSGMMQVDDRIINILYLHTLYL